MANSRVHPRNNEFDGLASRTQGPRLSSKKEMKGLALLSLVLLARVTLAQIDDVARIETAYQSLRQFSGIELQGSGNELINSRATNLASDIEWPWDENATLPDQKISVREFRNGSQISKTIGDGTTLWSLNLLRNEYVAHNYGSYIGTEPSDYRLDLIQHFNVLSKVPANYSARLLREVYGGVSPAFRSWVPGATVTVLSTTSSPQTDPITGRTYTPTPTKDYVMFELSGETNRSVVFERSNIALPDGSNNWCLANVYIAESASAGNYKLDLPLTPSPLTQAPPDSDFAFAPPISAKPIEGSMTNGH